MVLLWLAYEINTGVENYRSKEKALKEIAQRIDRAAGLPEGATQSASALAQLAIDANEGKAANVGMYRSLAAVLIFVAIGQFLIVLAAYRRGKPSNPTVKGNAPKTARPSL